MSKNLLGICYERATAFFNGLWPKFQFNLNNLFMYGKKFYRLAKGMRWWVFCSINATA